METLNEWGGSMLRYAVSISVQSAVLILVLGSMDWLLRKPVRAVTRYAIWMLLLIKLVLPTSFTLPTGIFRLSQPGEISSPREAREFASIPANDVLQLALPETTRPEISPEPSARRAPELNGAGIILLFWLGGASVLTVFIVRRCSRLAAMVKAARPAAVELNALFEECREQIRLRRAVSLRLTNEVFTPCVCGVRKPVILFPASLAGSLSPGEAKAVLLHELVHIARGDVGVNLIQTVLQVVHFYNALLWWANRRIRAVREEAVDEAVLVALGGDSAEYPSALVRVAKLMGGQSRPAFGSVGILESRSGFGARIRRILELPVPRSAKLGAGGLAVLAGLAVFLLPMAQAAGEKEEKQPGAIKDVRHSTSVNTVALSITTNTVSEAENPLRKASLDQLLDQFVMNDFRSRKQAAVKSELLGRGESLDFLMSKLKKDRSRPDTGAAVEARRKAARLLGEFGRRAASAVPLLLDCLEDDQEVRREATVALGNIGPQAKAAIPMLIEELHFQNTVAAQALLQIAPNSGEVLDAILAAAQDPSLGPDFRWQTTEALGLVRVKTERFRKALQVLAESPDENIRNAATRIQGNPAGLKEMRQMPRYEVKDVPALIQRLKASPDDFEAANGLRMLGTNAAPALPVAVEILRERRGLFPGNIVNIIGAIGPDAAGAVPLLIELTRGDDGMLVRNAIGALRNMGPAAKGATAVLAGLLQDPDREIAWMAANALMRIDPSQTARCTPILLTALDSPRDTRAFKISALADLGDAARPLVPRLIELLKEDEWSRISAAEVIGKVAPERKEEVVPMLIATLRDETVMNRHAAARMLGEYGSAAETALPLLRQMSEGEDELIAKASKEAVKQIESAIGR